MEKKKRERIFFYSKNDMTISYELVKIQELFTNININDDFDVNDFLEFYSIKQYFDNELFLKNWDDDFKKKCINLSSELFKKTAQYFNQKIDNTNIVEIINGLDFHYTELFYSLFDNFKLYKKIDPNVIISILEKKQYLIKYLLKYKNIVNNYQDDIKSFLESYNKTTELFLEKLEWDELYFPELLTIEQKEKIVLKYLEQDWRENMNKLEHISKLKDSNFLRLSRKTKLLAKKKHEEFVNNFFKWNGGIKYWYSVWLSEKQKEDIIVENPNPLEPKITYSINLFNTLYESNWISYLFINIFGYLDNRWNINLVNKESEMSALMELFSSNIAWEYKTWYQFQFEEIFSILNLITLTNYLKNFHDRDISSIIEYFITNLKLYNWFDKIIFRTDDLDKINNYYTKIKIIIPEFDLFVKQFICYIEEWEIDFELIWTEDSFLYENIPSLLEKKYFYENDEKLKGLKYHFFSDQSWLFYIEWLEWKYNNFYDLIRNEKLKLENFHNYQIDILKLLIEENILSINEDNYIKIRNDNFIFIIWEIYKKEVISYYWYSNLIQREIIEMEKLWYIYSKSSLLSSIESDYFNYYLKDYFPNSFWIRNKNVHWYYYWDENSAYNDFLILIKLIILIFLKIEDELYIINKIKNPTPSE